MLLALHLCSNACESSPVDRDRSPSPSPEELLFDDFRWRMWIVTCICLRHPNYECNGCLQYCTLHTFFVPFHTSYHIFHSRCFLCLANLSFSLAILASPSTLSKNNILVIKIYDITFPHMISYSSSVLLTLSFFLVASLLATRFLFRIF